ncbi:MAG: molybdenum cofactor sulfurase [Thermodesulfobacteriota bacterium]|nr:MAG: molybdenum cofactor sulfurase [Thermodesulfobacteriota bacterium]
MILKHEQTLADLRSINAANGKLSWIGIRPEHQQAMITPGKAILLENKGIEGDHIANGSSKKRQVTLIQEEHLPVVSELVKKNTVNPEFLRRNLVVGGINLLALKSEEFSIGECILKGTGLCHPCSRMEEALGKGGYNAMRGHGGITAIVIRGGTITLGDSVALLAK